MANCAIPQYSVSRKQKYSGISLLDFESQLQQWMEE